MRHDSRPPVDSALDAQWVRVRARLKGEVGEAAFKSWLKPLTLLAVEDGEIRLAVPTRFMRDWVRTHYADRIRTLWQAENKAIAGVDVIVQTATTTPARIDGAPRPAMARPGRAPGALDGGLLSAAQNDDDFGAPLDLRFTFDSFIVGKPNEFAVAAARRVADEPKVPFNPLFLYGGVGLGKTHLMHAIAWHIRKKHPNRRVIYLSAEKFMYQFIRALRFKDTMAFKEQFRSVDVLMID
ncbi:MAG TPA: DnaA/Hda family protein, partial [Alphaproteobacteria bacterium]|nr:DnaA/Hda family protein [Alphaproteobacteria bacterium]